MVLGKKEFVDMLAKKGYTKRDSSVIIDDFIDTVCQIMTSGDSVVFKNFGKFEVKKYKGRTSVNIKDGSLINIPDFLCPKFSASQTFRDEVNFKAARRFKAMERAAAREAMFDTDELEEVED